MEAKGMSMHVKTLDEKTLKRALTPPEKPAGIEIEVMRPTKLVVSAIRLQVPFDDEDGIADDFPGADHIRMTLTLTLDLATKRVRDWPAGLEADLCLKVRANGIYELLGQGAKVAAIRVKEYVPRSIPTGGDYVEFTILPDGSVKGWNPNARDIAIDFFGREDD